MDVSVSSQEDHRHHHTQQFSCHGGGHGFHLSPLIPSSSMHKPVTRSEISPYPTTFVQADPSSFKQVVQMLTGTSETAKQAAMKPSSPELPLTGRTQIPLMKNGQRKFKLFERRSSCTKGLKLSPLLPGVAHSAGISPRKPEMLSPSMLDLPALALSPVTPLIPDPFNRTSSSRDNEPGGPDAEAELKAIAEKGFYLHPSPSSTPRESEPRLLPLFPLTSPRSSASTTSSSTPPHSS